MLIRLIPPVPEPAILFSISFPNLPASVELPFSWRYQIDRLAAHDLELPVDIHALDKAAGIPTLIDEVSFHISSATVTCRFLDGSREEWPLLSTACMAALQRVMDDVNESGLVSERERRKDQDQPRIAEEAALPVPVSTPVKASRHKKQRSLLMTLVASLVPSSPRCSSPPTPPPPPPPPKKVQPPPPSSRLTSRDLRRRARSTLVDTFRLHVLTELSRRIPPGSYHTWILQSMLRRASEHMSYLVYQAGGRIPNITHASSRSQVDPSTQIPPSPFYDEDDGSEDSTDTDGSSLHTPTSSTFGHVAPATTPHVHFQQEHEKHEHVVHFPNPHPNTNSSRPLQTLSPEHLAEYTEYSAMAHRLRQSLLLANAETTSRANEIKQVEAIIEIKSRRRAWLNKSLFGGVRGNRDIGMAMPFQPSMLGRHSWSCEDYELQQAAALVNEFQKMKVGRSEIGEAQLFPVSEEEDEEEEEDATSIVRELELDFEVDLEGGLICGEDGRDFTIDRPQVPRVRTKSIHSNRLDSLECGLISPPRPNFPPSSILCQPLTQSLPPVYSDIEVGMGITGHGHHKYGGYAEEEFTLAMDLPLSVRAQDRDVFQTKRGSRDRGREREQHGRDQAYIPEDYGISAECR